jgi:hypothetical protein
MRWCRCCSRRLESSAQLVRADWLRSQHTQSVPCDILAAALAASLAGRLAGRQAGSIDHSIAELNAVSREVTAV